MAPKRAFSRHPSRGLLIGLYPRDANTVSVNQDLLSHSPYLVWNGHHNVSISGT